MGGGIIGGISNLFGGIDPIELIAQGFGIIGLVIIVLSFQFKKNSTFFLMQALGGSMFFLNFILIGAWAGAFFNLCCLVRGMLFMRNAKKVWKLVVVECAFVGCFVFSLFLNHDPLQIFLAALPCVALMILSVYMWKGNTKHIRWCQIASSSPAWIVHNCFNWSLGGLLCECFNIISSIIYLVRLRIEEKNEQA